MNIQMKYNLLTFCILSSLSSSAQESAFNAGIRLGGGYSVNSGVDKILVSEDYYSNYSFNNKGQFVPGAELFFLYRQAGSLWGVEAGIVYYNKTARVGYEDKNELNYTLSARYHHLGLAAYFNLYPFKARNSLHISLGGRIGANLSPNGLTYTGNQEDTKFSALGYPSVKETERLLKDKLKGRPDAALGGGIGYDFPFGMTLDLRYHYSLTNSIKTETNTYNWVEHDNRNQQIELTVGYMINIK